VIDFRTIAGAARPNQPLLSGAVRYPALVSMKEWSLRRRNRFPIALGMLFTISP
jgi:hypothetical protein